MRPRSAPDRIIGFDLSEVAVDGSLHQAPYGGEGTGPNPTDRAKLGWKWSVAVDANGITLGWVIDGANRNELILFAPTLDAVEANAMLAEIGTLHLGRGYDSGVTRERLAAAGIDYAVIQLRGTKIPGEMKHPLNWGSAGSSKQPTRGGRTTDNSAATPTGRPCTATLRSTSPP